MKKIVFSTTISGSLDIFKGQLKFLTQYFDVYAISSNQKQLKEIAEREGISFIEISMERSISIIKDLIGLIRFLKVIRKLRPDIVHGNTPKAAFLSMLSAYILRVPNRIYMCHGLRYQGYSGLFRIFLKLMEYITCSCATKVICVSNGVLETLKADKICFRKAILVLGGSANGIDLNYFNPEKLPKPFELYNLHNLSSNDFIYCFIGRIVKDKGINELFEAFNFLGKKYENIRLVIIGFEEGKLNPISEASRKMLNDDQKVRFVGRIVDVRPYLAIVDTLVLPSYREGLGIVLMEAAAMSVPCITTDVIGCNDVIIEGENGLFCKPYEVNSLITAMEKIYIDTELRKHIISVTRHSIAIRFEQKKVWAALLKEYQS